MAYPTNTDELLNLMQKMHNEYSKLLHEGADYFVAEECKDGFVYDDGKLIMSFKRNSSGKGYDLAWQTENGDTEDMHFPNVSDKKQAYKEFRDSVEEYWKVRLIDDFSIDKYPKLAERFKELDQKYL